MNSERFSSSFWSDESGVSLRPKLQTPGQTESATLTHTKSNFRLIEKVVIRASRTLPRNRSDEGEARFARVESSLSSDYSSDGKPMVG